jgi:succinoglycan biosynthesis transport protein ExoP
VLCSEVDITIMVVQHRRFPRAMLQRVKQAVLSVGGNLLGVVLNNVDVRHDQGYQYYTNYYNYYAPQGDAEQVKKRPKEVSRVPAARSGRDFHGGDEY